jgi:hypothetical protein
VTIEHDRESQASVPPAWFMIDPSAPPQVTPPELTLGPNDEVISATFRGRVAVTNGKVDPASKFTQRPDGLELNGKDEKLVFAVPAWPEEDYSVRLRVYVNALPSSRIAQVFSGWTSAMDDPLRLVIDQGKLYARIEAGSVFSTPGAEIQSNRWYDAAAVKQGSTLTLYIDGKAVGSCPAPPFSNTESVACSLGGNPRFGGNEYLAARFSDFAFYARALTPSEIDSLK